MFRSQFFCSRSSASVAAINRPHTREDAGADVTTTNTLNPALILVEHDGLSAASSAAHLYAH